MIKVISNHRGISLISTAYKMLTNILFSRLTPYVDTIIWDCQFVFQFNESTAG
jgi:hypothetical protein